MKIIYTGIIVIAMTAFTSCGENSTADQTKTEAKELTEELMDEMDSAADAVGEAADSLGTKVEEATVEVAN